MAADITEGISRKPRDNIGQHGRWWSQHIVGLTIDKFSQISWRRNVLRSLKKNTEMIFVYDHENFCFEDCEENLWDKPGKHLFVILIGQTGVNHSLMKKS